MYVDVGLCEQLWGPCLNPGSHGQSEGGPQAEKEIGEGADAPKFAVSFFSFIFASLRQTTTPLIQAAVPPATPQPWRLPLIHAA